jgi:hypothetical protein
MGHDLPRVLWAQLIDAIATHALTADAAVGHAGVPAREIPAERRDPSLRAAPISR